MKRITVIVDNRPGAVADVTSALAERGVNIEALDVEGTEEKGVINLTVDRYDEALQALRDASFQAISEDAIVIRLKDEPGAIARVAARFKAAGVNIQSMHILRRDADLSLVSIVCDQREEAVELVKDEIVSSMSGA